MLVVSGGRSCSPIRRRRYQVAMVIDSRVVRWSCGRVSIVRLVVVVFITVMGKVMWLVSTCVVLLG